MTAETLSDWGEEDHTEMGKVREFHVSSSQHHAAAKYLLSACLPNASSLMATEVVYLGGYVIECLLKAVLFANTRPRKHEMLEREVKFEIGHDLEKLRLRLERLRKPIRLPIQHGRLFRLINTQWHTNLRYEGKRMVTQEAQQFMDAVDSIVIWANEGVR